METKLQKWGNSLGVRLPKNITKHKALKAGTRVLVSESDTQIIIEAITDNPDSLADLLKNVSVANMHTETQWGEKIGKEVW